MWTVLFPVIIAVVAGCDEYDLAVRQLGIFRNKTKYPIGILTLDSGAPVEYREATNTLNTDLLSNAYFMDRYTELFRRNIPERIVHAPGAGAFGYFKVTHDISHICKAKLFSKVGKKTPIGVRFSPTFSSIGVPDTVRETRGFAIKFYTEEGTFDLVSINFPITTFVDPLVFPALVSVLKRNPVTNLPDHNMIWDFLTLHPEAFHQFLRLLSYEGMPRSYRHMPGFSVHTYQLYNAKGQSFYGRMYCTPLEGLEFYNASAAATLQAGDHDFYARDLWNNIANGNFPSWELSIQIISEEDAKNPDLRIFDVTFELPADKYPLHPVGVFTLNKNPTNNFAEMEQMALCPGNVVPGIRGSPDKVYQARSLGYREAAIYRLGSNFKKIPVNCLMQKKVLTYNRNGVSPVNNNGKDGPNYYPNSFNGAYPYKDDKRPALLKIIDQLPDNFEQASNYYCSLDSEAQRDLVANIVKHITPCENDIKERGIQALMEINSELGNRVAENLDPSCAY